MHIVVFAFGSRGDVQPYLALAIGLQHAARRVMLVASRMFAAWIRSHPSGYLQR
jgi:sterol 3beta-glucosyltransferase